ncbi:hypothetical protein F9B82_08265 [Lacticaseibacillus casei]|nr:hypothetical protein F9B82_08265 [Lacticaseibacillus casei]
MKLVLNGRISRFRPRPSFETQPGLLRRAHHSSCAVASPQPAGDCGVWHGNKLITLDLQCLFHPSKNP